MLCQFLLIVRTVEALVKTTGIKAGELRFSGCNHGKATLSSVVFCMTWLCKIKPWLSSMMQTRKPQLDRDTGFAFTDPFGMRLKQEKTFSAWAMVSP